MSVTYIAVGGDQRMWIIFILIAWFIAEILFWITHRKPLTDEEIRKLSKKRARIYARKKYQFPQVAISVNKEFKSALKPSGKLYSIDESLQTFPSLVAALLKGKKHEWMVLAIEKEGRVNYLWANKGDDNQSVGLSCDLSDIVDLCQENQMYSVLRFHNHPNSNPKYQTGLLASKQDRIRAKYCSDIVNKNGMNWFDFVCERGNFIIFSRNISQDFCPQCANTEEIRKTNGISEKQNYRLQRELRWIR